ncbi:M81 family metallopeptidase [Pigmentiphaga aceris]|uniref:M81 family metallopeptidase n=1 Tax=Pigmentiphaga aceris TaxID=1940612 RepID=A0A5C0B211_9BURK|nr:M81 family metallopeptidase [Pigmentiphaga aceris]QEI06637.1 M81 family metallopeptidase [Pigmentiphaga aceris]
MSAHFRIAIASFHIECVSFLPVPSTLADFEDVALRGDEIITQLRGTNTVIGGFVDICEAEDMAMLPIVHTALGAVGPATDDAVLHYATEIAEGVRQAADTLDGVLLFLHGACWAPSYPDPEKFILDRVRAALGPDKPLMVALDYHANLDADSLASVNAAFAYRKSPHTDTGETGRRAARCMVRTLRGEISPVWAIAKPGVLVPSIFSATALRPLADIIEDAASIEASSPAYTDITVMAGFSYADAHNTGFSVLCVTDADAPRAQTVADGLSARIHDHRQALYRPLPVYQVDEAIDHVLARLTQAPANGKPYVLLEHADRMNDSTYLLDALLKRGAGTIRIGVPYLWDAAAAQQASDAGAGNTVQLQLGGHSSDKAGPTLAVTARVLWAGPKQYRVSGTYMQGMPVDLGMTALLDIDGISVSVVSAFAFAVDGDAFTIFGQRPEDFDILVLRSKTHFRAFYEPLAAEILIVDTPDYGLAELRQLPYRHVDMQRNFPFTEPA